MEQQQIQTQSQMMLENQKAQNQASLIQLKEDNANFRSEISAVSKNLDLLLQKFDEGISGISPMTQQMEMAAQAQQQAAELAQQRIRDAANAENAAATRAALEDERGFRRASTRVENAMPGDALDATGRAELDAA